VAPRLADLLVDWQRRAGRHELPWQRTRDPYRIWLSEIMLQQTQVATVLGYYARFLERFPDLRTLADAPADAVLGAWSGLGYYSRARNLHRCARAVVEHHGGRFPTDAATLATLPGIGRSTAAAIAAFATGAPAAILDGNVKRVLARAFAIDGFPGEAAVERRLWAIAERELPEPGDGRVEAYTQGLMDLGATVCVRVRPRCEACPLAIRCEARRQARVDALPAPRPARAGATRRAEWVLATAGAAVLLERRPPAGLWGGLWSLPEFEPPRAVPAGARADAPIVDPRTVSDWLAARVGREAGTAAPHARVRHAFTHFRLQARVWRCALPGDPGEAPPGHAWLTLAALEGAPLPRPVRVLLEALRVAGPG